MADPIPDLVQVRRVEQARTLLHPIRISLLQHLREPRTCAELAAELGMTPQRINNHLKALVEAELVHVVGEDRVRNLVRATYQAAGKVVWLSPALVRDEPPGDRTLRDRLALDGLLELAETVTEDVAVLLSRTGHGEVPSIGLSVEIHLRSAEERQAFAQDVLQALKPVLKRYEGPEGSDGAFQLTLMCYPKEPDHG